MYYYDKEYGVDTIHFLSFILLNSAFCVFIFMSVEIFKGIIYTGYPYMNIDLKIKAKYKKNVLLFWVFGKVFNMLLCSFMLISSTMTGHSYSTIEEFLSEDDFNIITFFTAMGIDVFFTEIVNVLFTLNNTFIESFDPEEIARESSLLMNDLMEDQLKEENGQPGSEETEENVMARTLQTLQSTFNTTFNLTSDASLNLDSTNLMNKSSKRSKKFSKNQKINFATINVKDIEIDKDYIFERSDGLGVAYIGTYKGIRVKIRQIALKDISSFVQRQIPTELKKWREIREESVESYLGVIQNDQ